MIKLLISFRLKAINGIIKWDHYLNYYKLVRQIAWILKLQMIYIYINSKQYNDSNKTLKKRLILGDINNAKNETLKHSQKESFQKEFKEILQNQPFKKGSLISFSFFVEDGLIRVGGRICRSSLPFSSKHQGILSNCHPLSAFLKTYIYEKHNHSGRELTLNLLCASFWIIKCKGLLIRNILNKCLFIHLFFIQV